MMSLMGDLHPAATFRYIPEKEEIAFEIKVKDDILPESEKRVWVIEELQPDFMEKLKKFSAGSEESGIFSCTLLNPSGGERGIVAVRRDDGVVFGEIYLLPTGDALLEKGKEGNEEKKIMEILIKEMMDSLLYELRNSFSHIHLTINLIEVSHKGKLPDDVWKRLEEIKEEMDFSLKNLEEISGRMESFFREATLEMSPVAVKEVLKNAMEDLKGVLNTKKIKVRSLCDIPDVVIADRKALKSAFQAILELAVLKADVGSELTILCGKMDKETIQITLSYVGEEMEGEGEFERGSGEVKERGSEFFWFKYNFARVVIEKHGGSFRVESMEDVGSTIFVELPVTEGGEVR